MLVLVVVEIWVQLQILCLGLVVGATSLALEVLVVLEVALAEQAEELVGLVVV